MPKVRKNQDDGRADGAPVSALREAERLKYCDAYQRDSYRMGGARQVQARRLLEGLPLRGSLLDVATGRGELLTFAADAGFDPVRGTEIVPDLCGDNVTEAPAHALPFADDGFDVVTCFDMLEHLVPSDTEKVIAELFRVARRAVVLTIATYSHQENGVEYHINLRTPAEWAALLPQPTRWRVSGQQIEAVFLC